MRLLLSLVETLCVFVVVFYLYCRSPAFRPLRPDWQRPRGKLGLYLVFSGIAILGNYLGFPVMNGEAIVNGRAVGSVLAGLLGGPVLGVLVGVTAGVHRVTAMSGAAALAGAIATTLEGLMAGLVHLALRRRRPERLTSRSVAFATALVGEVMHMGIVLAMAGPYEQALAIVKMIAPAMVILNPIGAALFMTVLLDRQREQDRIAAASSERALRVAERALGLMARGFRPEAAREMAAIVKEETGVGAVGVTDTERVLSWVGLGADHHVPGTPISSPFTRQSIAGNAVVFADGVEQGYDCRVSRTCPLQSVLIVPLQVDGVVVGTVQLFEPRSRRFLKMNKRLGEGIGALLSSQLLIARYQEQKNLLVMSELKLLQAQVNPHFLFNALNTIIAVTRKNPARARELLVHLANFFRKNLKRSGQLSTLQEELEHVSAYLEIEKARFEDRLVVSTDVDPSLLSLRLPTFTLQPLIENAIKHGLSATLDRGAARIRAYRSDGVALIEIEDDAGTWTEPRAGAAVTGLGMKIVDRRIKELLGERYGITVSCVPNQLTRVTVRMPVEGVAPEGVAS
jgi:two-component system LytT family sensor kinase